ncbi:MAG: Uma2 family endonuclease [Armatimonadetes bacterium]|nr:Uma2 family endonuclease [Armatimonadota bacterium]
MLVLAFHDTHYVGVQLPLKLSEYSGPEPDFFLMPKRDEEPEPEQVTPDRLRKADLVIEVAVSSLAYDRDEKASLYAKYGVPDYWVLEVVKRRLLVHRNPVAMEERIFGHGYASVEILSEEASIAPLARPDVQVPVRGFY